MIAAWRSPAFLCALGAALMAVALQISSGMFDPLALAFAAGATTLSIAAAFLGRGPRATLPAQIALGSGFLHGIVCHLFYVPTFYADPRRLGGFRGLALMALVFGSAYLCIHLRASLQKLRFWGSMALFVAMAAAILHVSPQPWIDVFVFQQQGAAALSRGFNPYQIGFPDLYAATGETLRMYGQGVVHEGRVWAYPYPPLTLLLEVPFFKVLGDVRWANLLGLAVAAWAIARIGAGVVGEIAALFMLFQARTFFVLEQAWTEPVVLAAFCVCLLLLVRPARRMPQWLALGLALGVLAATKQYSPLLLLPLGLALPRGQRLRPAAVALAFLGAVLLPFVVWDARELWHDVVVLQFLQPVRTDALSVLSLWARVRPLPASAAAIAFVAACAVLLVSLRRGVTPARAATSAAAAWLVFVLLNKQAFCNYDWLGTGLLCAAVAAHSRPEESGEG